MRSGWVASRPKGSGFLSIVKVLAVQPLWGKLRDFSQPHRQGLGTQLGQLVSIISDALARGGGYPASHISKLVFAGFLSLGFGLANIAGCFISLLRPRNSLD